MSRLISLCACAIIAAISLAPDTKCMSASTQVLLKDVVASPTRYDDQELTTYGYVTLGFENSAIYVGKEDAEHLNTNNSVWLVLSYPIKNNSTTYNKQYCLIKGTFNSSNTGHFGLWPGSLENVTSISIAPTPEESMVMCQKVLLDVGNDIERIKSTFKELSDFDQNNRTCVDERGIYYKHNVRYIFPTADDPKQRTARTVVGDGACQFVMDFKPAGETWQDPENIPVLYYRYNMQGRVIIKTPNPELRRALENIVKSRLTQLQEQENVR